MDSGQSLFECYLCHTPLVGDARTKEHIVLNALGGRYHSYDLICRGCNAKMGHSIDAELAKQLTPVANLLGLERKRGRARNVIVAREDGEEFVREPGGRLHPSRTMVATHIQGSRLHYEARGAPRKIRQALRKLQKKYPSIDVADALEQVEDQVTYVREPLTFTLNQLGGDEALRAVAKTAANFAVWKGRVRTPSCASFISGAEAQNGFAWWWVGPDPLVRRPPRGVLNAIVLVGGEGVVRAYVELLHAFRFGVLVQETYDGPDFVQSLARDALTGFEVDLDPNAFEWEVSEYPPAEAVREHLLTVIREAEVTSFERTLADIVDHAFARARETSGPDANADDLRSSFWKELEPLLVGLASGSRHPERGSLDE